MTPDLRTRYLGLDLRSPIVASSTPLTGDPSFVKQLEDAGVGAVVLPSLFEEEILNDEIELSRALEQGTEQFAEALGYFPAQTEFRASATSTSPALEKTKEAVAVPVIASLNADSTGGWVRYARLMQDAGADALELNLYHVAADPRSDRRPGAGGHRPRGRGPRRHHHPVRRQAQPLLRGHGELRGAGRGRRSRRPGAVQPLLPAGPRPRHVRRRHQGLAEPPLGAADAAPLDRDPAAAAGRRTASRPRPASTARPTRSRRSRWAPTS